MVHELIVRNWVDFAFAVITAALTWAYRNLSTKIKEEQKKHDCVATGVQCLLRQNILSTYYEYTKQGYCPVEMKQSLAMMYDAYSGLGGNDVATALYHKVLELPSEPEDKNDTC